MSNAVAKVENRVTRGILSPELKNTTINRGYTDGVNLESPSGLTNNIPQDTNFVNSKSPNDLQKVRTRGGYTAQDLIAKALRPISKNKTS